jgi:hypothetical protein
MANHQVSAIETLKRKIYNEAQERYIKEQEGLKIETDEGTTL